MYGIMRSVNEVSLGKGGKCKGRDLGIPLYREMEKNEIREEARKIDLLGGSKDEGELEAKIHLLGESRDAGEMEAKIDLLGGSRDAGELEAKIELLGGSKDGGELFRIFEVKMR